MLAEKGIVITNTCFLVTLSKLLSAYILLERTSNSDNNGDTRVWPHRGDAVILRLRQAFLEWRYLGFALGSVRATWLARQASCLRNASAGCAGGDNDVQK